LSWKPQWRGEGGGSELLRLAFPLILSNSFLAVQLFVDRVLLSQADSDAVAASMPAAVLYWTLIVLPQNVVMYAAVFVAQYLGAGRPHRVGPAVWQALYFAVGAGLAFMTLSWLANDLTRLMGHSPAIQLLEAAYFRILCFAALPALIVFAITAFFSGRGDTWITLFINAVAAAVNVPLAYALIRGEWGFPELGIEGAGWATVAGSAAAAVVALGIFFSPYFQRQYDTLSGWRLDTDLFQRLMRFGFPNGLQWTLDCLAFNFFLVMMGWIGDAALTATSVAFAINMLAPLPVFGIGQAVEILVGRRLGEDRPEVAERSTWSGFALGWTYMSVVAVLYVCIPDVFIQLFANETSPKWPEAAALIPGILIFMAVYTLFDSMNLTFSFALRGAGDTRFVTVVSIALAWLICVAPTALAYHNGWGVYWAWGFASGWIIALGVTFLLRFLHGKWKSMRVIEAAEPLEEADPEALAEEAAV
jgi:MATE family multidrug resistance protein